LNPVHHRADERSDLLTWAIRGAGLAVGVALVALLGGLALAASRVLLLVFVAILLASALEPVIGWIRNHTRVGRGTAILLTYATFFASVVGLVLVVVPAAFNQFNDIVAELPPLLDRGREWAANIRPGGLSTSITALLDSLETTLRPAPPDPNEVVEVGLTVAEAVLSVVTLLAIVFFWLVEHARIQRFALLSCPAGAAPGRARRGTRSRTAWDCGCAAS